MKKILFSAVLLGALASCSQNEVQEMGQFNNEIQFSTLNNKVSRAANDTKSDYQVFAKSFGLTIVGTPTWYIEDVLKSTSNPATQTGGFNSSTVDTPTKTHYWPNVTGDWAMNFYAFAPATSVDKSIKATVVYGTKNAYADRDADDASVSIKYVVPTSTTDPDAQEDFTISIPLQIDKSTKGTNNNVNLQFKHMLTKVTVNAALNQELLDAGYKMTYTTPQLKVVNTEGTISVTAAAPSWSDLVASGALYEGSDTYLILPQPSAGNQLILPTVTITKNGVVVFEGPVTYTVKDGDILNAAGTADDDAFLAGNSYNMNITIAGDSGDGQDPDPEDIFGPKITFSSEVADWENYTPGVTQPAVDE
ncbi:MAG: fimbrillin family protein [Phocaeicola sp.]